MGRPLGPGGALLRSSRMFSLPTPITPPPSEAQSATATSGFPTRQTVTTTPESRKVGDWGFKHPLPLKTTTKSSTPYIRVAQVSAPESVTTFRSAADHTLTLDKFHEMKIAMMQPRVRTNVALLREPPRSVFEDAYDFTHVDAGAAAATATANAADKHSAGVLSRRWKFSGPWLAGMTSGSFEKYLDRTVRDPKHRFRFQRFLRKILVDRLNEDMVRNNIRDGVETYPFMLLREQDVTEDQMIDFLRELRADMPQMYRLIGRFLDLAPMKPASERQTFDGADGSTNPYAVSGPPRTHPSTGISYLRTASFMENHPLHGPQAYHAAIEARVMAPGRNGVTPRIGLGGFVALAVDHNLRSRGSSVGAAPASDLSSLWNFDRNARGGAKLWAVNPSATVRPSGTIHVVVAKAPDDAALNARELRGENVDALRQRRLMYINQPIRRPSAFMPTTSGYGWIPKVPSRY